MFGINHVLPGSGQTTVGIDIAEPDRVGTIIVRNEEKQIHSEQVSGSGIQEVSFERVGEGPTVLTVEALGDGSLIGSFKFYTNCPAA